LTKLAVRKEMKTILPVSGYTFDLKQFEFNASLSYPKITQSALASGNSCTLFYCD